MIPITPYYRQIHLDFHTSEHITGIGKEFDEDRFADALALGKVDSINFFAMCHHGWCYYPTKTDLAHPHLQTDLVGGMMNACRKAGVNPVVYITVGWHDKAAREHPEWCIRRSDGTFDGPPRLHPHSPRSGGWYRMCYNTPYLDEVVLPVTREIMEMYNPAGIWFDITGEHVCTCDHCRASMRSEGLDPVSPPDLKTWAKLSYRNYLKKTTGIVWGANPNATIYHNGSAKKNRYDVYPYWSHMEIESLPTGGWGYSHFPPQARYFTVLPGTSVVSMTGKFHKSWGEFGGFKSPAALRYECAQIMSLGCMACVGDQLHPSGEMDRETYRIIGEAYKDIEAREPWLRQAHPVADVAVLTPASCGAEPEAATRTDESEVGVGSMLMELQVPHIIVDAAMDFAPYRILILADAVPVDAALAGKLDAFVKRGGKLLLSGRSGLDETGTRFAVDVGAVHTGRSPWDVEFVEASERIAAGLVRSPFLVYHSGETVRVTDAEVLAETWQPYFSRTHGHFCSHRNTPPEKRAGWPAVIKKRNVVYMSQPIFRVYAQEGMRLHRDLVRNCLALLDSDPLVRVGMPSCGRTSVMRQEKERRTIVHLVYANPIKRGAVEVIDDIVPLHHVPVSLRAAAKPKRVSLAPDGIELPFSFQAGRVEVSLETLDLHAMVVVED